MGPKHINQLIFFLWMLSGCSASVNPWAVDRIPVGDPSFDSSRLRFISSQPHPPLLFEILKMGDQINGFLSLNRFRLTLIDGSNQVKILLNIGDEVHEALVFVHEGQMRVTLPPEITQKIIQALQDGQKVAILIDDFEERLDPQQFSASFAKFLGRGSFFQTILKGPL